MSGKKFSLAATIMAGATAAGSKTITTGKRTAATTSSTGPAAKRVGASGLAGRIGARPGAAPAKPDEALNYFGPGSKPVVKINYTSLEELKKQPTFAQRSGLVAGLPDVLAVVKAGQDSESDIAVIDSDPFGLLALALIEVPSINTVYTLNDLVPGSKQSVAAKQILDMNLNSAGFQASPGDDGVYTVYTNPGGKTIYSGMTSLSDFFTGLQEGLAPAMLMLSGITDAENVHAWSDYFLETSPQGLVIVTTNAEIPGTEKLGVRNNILSSFALVYSTGTPGVDENISAISFEMKSATGATAVSVSLPGSDAEPISAWFERIKSKIKEIIAGALDNELASKMLNDLHILKLFAQAFTHETIDPAAPYDTIAIIGDDVLDLAFHSYLLEKKPTLTAAQISILKANYLDKRYFSRMGAELGFREVIRVDSQDISVDIYEDVVESFFGAVYLALDYIFKKKGAGLPGAYRLFLKYFDGKVDVENITADPFTILKEIYDRMGWRNVTIVTDTEGFYIPAPKGRNAGNLPEILASTKVETKKAAKQLLAKDAIKTLEKAGITTEYAIQYKFDQELRNIGRDGHSDSIKAYLERNGYSRLEFVEPKKTETKAASTIQIWAFRKDGTPVLLGSTAGVSKLATNDAKAALIDQIILV